MTHARPLAPQPPLGVSPPDLAQDGAGSTARRRWPVPPPARLSRHAFLRRAAAVGAGVAAAWAAAPSTPRRALAKETGPLPGARPELPDTPPGRLLARWLEAFNGADAGGLLECYRGLAPEEMAAQRATFDLLARRSGGPVEVQRVLESTEERLAALLLSSLSELWLRIEVGGPVGLRLQPAPPPPELLAGEPVSDEALRRELQRFLDKLVAADAFSGAVLVAREGEPLFAAAYGLADQATGEPNRVSTRFNLASMGKMFTAVAVAQLVEQGRLAFTDTLASVLPDYPNRAVAEQVTVHHLLTHTSGLGDFFGPRYLQVRDELRDLRDYLPLFADAPLAFPPGTSWSYSNAGYVVLGTVIERVSGQDYYDYIRAHLYGPAGMTRSDAFERDASEPDLALGYAIIPNPIQGLRPEMASQPRVVNTATLGPRGTSAGGSYATVEDVLAFARALRGHRLLSQPYTDLVLSSKVETDRPTAEGYAYGFVAASLHGARIAGHGGSGPGVSTNLDLFLDHGVTAVVLSNYDGISPVASAAGPVMHKIRNLVVRA